MAAIRKRGNSYTIEISIGYDESGKQVKKYATFPYDTSKSDSVNEKNVSKYAAILENRIKRGEIVCDERITLTKFIREHYLPEYAEGALREDTLSAYKDDIERFIIPRLGDRRLISIRGNDISRFYLELLHLPKQNGKGTLSASTVRHTGSVLGSIFRRAVMWEYISVNPCDSQHSEMPKLQRSSKKRKVLNAEEIMTLLEYLDSEMDVVVPTRHRVNPRTGQTYEVAGYTAKKKVVSEDLVLFFYMALFLGCRRGELIALRWSDIDFDTCVVHITKDTVLCSNHKVVQNRTKNESSIRDIPIPVHVMELLLLHRKSQTEEIRAKGEKWIGPTGADAFLFTQKDGTQMYPTTPSRAFRRTLKRFNETRGSLAGQQFPETGEFPNLNQIPANAPQLPEIHLHGLRASCISYLIANNVDPKTVASIAGHSRVSTTTDIYASPYDSNRISAIGKFDEFLNERLLRSQKVI